MTPNKLPPLPETIASLRASIARIHDGLMPQDWEEEAVKIIGLIPSICDHFDNSLVTHSVAYRGLQSCRDLLGNQFTPKFGENFDGYLDAMTDALKWMRWAERRIADFAAHEALRQSQSLPAGAVAGLSAKVTFVGPGVAGLHVDGAYFGPHMIGEGDEIIVLKKSALHADAREKGEALGRCCYGGYRTKAACASCSAWTATQPAQASEAVDGFEEWHKSVWGGSDEEPIPEWRSERWNEYIEHRQLARGAWEAAIAFATHPQPVTPAGGEVVARRFVGVGELERTGYIPAGSAAEREANPPVADAALVRDAERYRFIRTRLYSDIVEVGEAEINMRVIGACPSLDEFDAAIDDAALNQRGGGDV